MIKNKIILVGFPKSGTSSFQFLFKKLRMRTYHWTYKNKKIGSIMKKNKENNKKLLKGIENWDCITQMDVCISDSENFFPQISDLEKLCEENIDCIFILNKRDPEKMLHSWKNWNQLDKRLYKFNPELIKEKNDEGLIRFFNDHFKRVESFFKERPHLKFISFDIEKDSITKLNKYIDIKDFVKLPRKNVSINS